MLELNSFFLLKCKKKKKILYTFFYKHTFAHCSQRVLFKGLVSKMLQACLDVVLQTCDAAFCGEDTGRDFSCADASMKAIFVQASLNS